MNDLKWVCTTSDSYHPLLRVAIYLFNKNISSEILVEIVGYDKPDFELPDNWTFYSLGKQVGGPTNFSTDLRPYFEKQDDFFVWMFDDTFCRGIYFEKWDLLESFCAPSVGRLNLCSRATKLQDHFQSVYWGHPVLENTQTADYRLCTQPSIWNREFLLKYLTPGLSPWKFETQDPKNDGFRILGLEEEVLTHNEGTTKHNIWKLDLHGVPAEQIQEMEGLSILNSKMEYAR